ncbi:MAG: stage IV sporulation protein A [Bacillota bacterium]
MEKFDLLQDIAERTGGDIYLGVVGPVRTGKSTFIKRFMDLLVLPNITDENDRERTKDSLPQSGAGRTIMTTEPKFIPDEAVEIQVDNYVLRVRMVDCVGYAVKGALGYTEESGPRMVLTPWHDEPIPFEEAAELGTRKVIADHSTIGVVITTDGTITDLPREAYESAEERVVKELQELGKPFIIVLNSANPFNPEALALKEELEAKYQAAVVPLDCTRLNTADIHGLLREILYEFPVKEVTVSLPDWVEVLGDQHWLRRKLDQAVREGVVKVKRLREIDYLIDHLSECDAVTEVILEKMELGSGVARLSLDTPPHLYWEVLSSEANAEITGPAALMGMMREYATAKFEYGKLKDAVRDARNTGYGIVPPTLDDMLLEEPEIIRQGNRFGVRLRASAPAYHLIRVDVQSEVAPIIGTEKQSEELAKYLLDEFEANPEKLWESNLFGKSLHTLVREGIQNKLTTMPDNAQEKLRETLERIVNEGSGSLIAIIL